ncbi:unknown [[Mannheimia] succiniciproducens MBEL55E]|uniref:Uncharacterized protein n=1 Tax=Mannheimia succiniciproducens (strain KCTC 0769BP / MBEL55E) TaxID=221988 RepID=Q65T47_MANSM|nr:unknown [[Mannheimia] succiniciproducens MBEL55E]
MHRILGEQNEKMDCYFSYCAYLGWNLVENSRTTSAENRIA